MSKNTAFIKSFSKILEAKNDLGYPAWPLLHLIIKNASCCLPQLILLAKGNKEIMQAIHRLMSMDVTIKWTDGSNSTMNGFELLGQSASDYEARFHELFALAKSSLANMNTLFHKKYSPLNSDFASQKENFNAKNYIATC